jgi:hypothetical protein
MATVFRTRFFQGLIVFMFTGAAFLVGRLGVSLLVGAATSHGSRGGNILSIGLGLILLLLSPVAFIVGIVYLILSGPSLGDKNS